MQKFAFRRSGAPQGYFFFIADFGVMKFSDQSWQYVRTFQIKIVIRAVKIGRHQTYKISPMLFVVRLAHNNAGNFGRSISLICWLERPGHKIFFFDWLETVSRVDTRTAEEKQLLNFIQVGIVNDIILYRQIFVYKVGRISIVGKNTAYFCRGEENVFRFFLGEKSFNSIIIK